MNYWEMSALGELIKTTLLLLGLVTVVVTYLLIKARERKRIHDALTRALDKGIAPPPEVLKALTESIRPPAPVRPLPQRDLRNGVIWLSVAIGLAVLALSLVLGHDPRHLHLPIKEPLAALGIAAFPAALGFGYIILWLVEKDKEP